MKSIRNDELKEAIIKDSEKDIWTFIEKLKTAELITIIDEDSKIKVFKKDINYIVLFTDLDEVEIEIEGELKAISMKELFNILKEEDLDIEDLYINPYTESSLHLDLENFLFIFE